LPVRDAPRASRRWLRTRAAAEHLGIGVGTLNKLRTYGGGPHYAKLGRVVVYDPDELDRWAAARTIGSTKDRVWPA
jgi:hypothetical protein